MRHERRTPKERRKGKERERKKMRGRTEVRGKTEGGERRDKTGRRSRERSRKVGEEENWQGRGRERRKSACVKCTVTFHDFPHVNNLCNVKCT